MVCTSRRQRFTLPVSAQCCSILTTTKRTRTWTRYDSSRRSSRRRSRRSRSAETLCKSEPEYTGTNRRRPPPRQRKALASSTKPRKRRSRSKGALASSSVRGIPHWWELSVDDLYGEMLVRMSWYQILNRRRNMKIHLILTEEHQQLPIIKNQAVLKLVGKTDNFIPTPSAQQLIRNVSQSLNIFSVRVYNRFSGFIHRNRIEESRLAAEAAGIPPWKPKTFNHNQTWYANRIAFVFSRQNTTWDQNFRLCPELQKILGTFQQEIQIKAQAICKALRKCKWRNLSLAERQAVGEVR